MRFGKIDVRYLGAVLALAFSLLIIVSVVLRQGADWWSAWGQWVGGAGSIGAAGVAVWIAVEGWRRSDLDAKKMRERELASKVALWIEQTEAQRNQQTVQSPEQLVRTSARFVLKYINGGGMPIYKAEATVTFPNGPAPYIDTQLMLRPTTTPEDFERTPETFHQILEAALLKERTLLKAQLVEASLDDLPPGMAPILLDDRFVIEAMLMIISQASITFAFSDANNVRWVRHPNGELARA
ncbi:hypothetical protein [Amycolatopsis sp. lyj-90]|uniref:hypothetical protein n=1 Tax=Amycolatopsis sp. lyj-90 TaxID=2789285 RepID=UPI00397D4D09